MYKTQTQTQTCVCKYKYTTALHAFLFGCLTSVTVTLNIDNAPQRQFVVMIFSPFVICNHKQVDCSPLFKNMGTVFIDLLDHRINLLDQLISHLYCNFEALFLEKLLYYLGTES